MLRIVISKLCKCQLVKPVAFMHIAVTSQVVLKGLVLAICFTISLRIECSA
jgi:hypothetical protein